MGRALDFWYSIGSTYTYLAVMRVDEVCAAHGITARWRPFDVRRIMLEIGNRPFTGKPAKLAYMWRDLERRAAMYGIPARLPAPYPLAHLERANRVAVCGEAAGWHVAYTREAYRKWFQDGIEPGGEPDLSDALRTIGQDPAAVLVEADGEAVARATEAATDAARDLGIFGSPTFVVDGELFWGHDRLDDAVSWCRFGEVRTAG